MSYVEQNLMPGENILYQAKLHWAMFINPLISLIIGIVILLLAPILDDSALVTMFYILGGLFCLSAVLSELGAITSFFTTEFALTDRRIIAKSGLVRRHSLELLLSKVESVGVSQGIWGRILNFGTITITGTGGTKEPFKNIANPMELRKRVNAQIAGG